MRNSAGRSREKQKRRPRLLAYDAFDFSFDRPRPLVKGLAALACTRSNRRFCIPKFLLRRIFPGQHPNRSLALLTFARLVPLGLFLVAFPPQPVTFPATRLVDPKIVKRHSTRLADHFQRVLPVFIRATQVTPSVATLASLSASASGVLDSGFPLLLSVNCVSPPPFHLLMPVKMPVSNLDCDAILHPLFSMSSRKHFNYRPYFMGTLWIYCGKLCGKNVDKNVENSLTSFSSSS